MFHADFVVLDTKEDLEGYGILGRPFLAIGKEKIDVETSELILKFNKNLFSRCMIDWTPCVENLDTCYHLEEKDSKINK